MAPVFVSVIVPVYNVEPYLRETVDAILRQSYENFELILVDDGSPDRCGELCDSYAHEDARVKVIHKLNGGLSSARNVGLDLCTGDYIVCIDSDDLVSVEYLSYLVNLVEMYHCDIAICGCRDFHDGDKCSFSAQEERSVKELSKSEALEMFLYMKEIRTGVIGKLIKRELYQGIKYPDAKYYEDIFTIYSLLSKAETVAYGSCIHFGYRLRVSGQSKQAFTLRDMDCIDFSDKLYSSVSERYPELRKAAACRGLSANSHIFYMLPDYAYEVQHTRIWKNIKKYRFTVLADKKARKKARAMALLSYGGKTAAYYIGKKLMRNT